MDIKSWAVGFIEGEGLFMITSRARVKDGIKHYYPILTIQLRLDDRNIIKYLSKAMEFEPYQIVKPAVGKRGKHYWESKPTIQFLWSSKVGLLAVKKMLDVHPMFGKKRKEYKYWRKAVEVFCLHGFPIENRDKIILKIKEKIQLIRKYKDMSTQL